MLDLVINNIRKYNNLNDTKIMLDCTLGDGGHILAAHDQFSNLRIIAIDKDPDIIENFH